VNKGIVLLGVLAIVLSCSPVQQEYPKQLTDFLSANGLDIHSKDVYIFPFLFCEDCFIACLNTTHDLHNSVIIIVGSLNSEAINSALSRSTFTFQDKANNLVREYGFSAYEPVHLSIRNKRSNGEF
jgi:hypothetical protein